MKILVIGSGGREHAIVWKLAQSKLATKIWIAPGNGGTMELAESVPIPQSQVEDLAEWAKRANIDLTVVGPEEPLSLGISDEFQKRGLTIFGPVKQAAQMEWSKAFAKDVMLKAGIKTATGAVFTDYSEAISFINSQTSAPVIKADGLAAGKGVVVPESKEQAITAVKELMMDGVLGDAGKRVVLEERLEGKEASVMALISGDVILPLVISSDHKRIFDGDQGPNTGGMGAISPTPVLSEDRLPALVETIFRPTINELKNRGIEYRGFLYAGVMVSPSGDVSVIEFNSRLGDPETQVLMIRLKSDLVDVLTRAAKGELAGYELSWNTDCAACVVLASAGYPGKVSDGKEISGLFPAKSDLVVFHAGTKTQGDKVITKGGRILGVTATGSNLEAALEKAYEGVSQVNFEGMQFRKDIGYAL